MGLTDTGYRNYEFRGWLMRAIVITLRIAHANRNCPDHRICLPPTGCVLNGSTQHLTDWRTMSSSTREGDLIFGRKMRAIGTLVERHSRYVIPLKLPNGHGAESVRKAMTKRILTLPAQLRRSVQFPQEIPASSRR